MTTSRRTSGQRAGLTQAQVLAEARALLADLGLAGLTMRALAARLGVQPNTLYSHVAGKEDLVEALLDENLAQVPCPAPQVDWRAGLHALLSATHEVLLAAPDLVPLYLGRGARGPHARRLGDDVLALLARAGVTGPAGHEALRVLIVYTIGFAAFSTRPGFTDADETARRGELAANFDRGLGWLLAGIAP